MKNEIELTTLWYDALRAEIGIEVATDNPMRLRAELYRLREQLADPELYALVVTLHPQTGASVWIAHKLKVTDHAEIPRAAAEAPDQPL